MKQLTDEVFAQVREAFVKAEDCIQAMTDGPHRGDWGSTLDVLEKALAALDTAQLEPLITVESSLRFRLESEQQKSADLLDEVRELKGKLLQAQPERAPLSLQEIADAWGLKPENIPASDIEAVREIEAAHGIKQAKPERAPSTKGSDQVWFAQSYGIKQGGQHD